MYRISTEEEKNFYNRVNFIILIPLASGVLKQ